VAAAWAMTRTAVKAGIALFARSALRRSSLGPFRGFKSGDKVNLRASARA
jgi:hypothetical protein